VLRDPKAAEILASVDFDSEKYGRGWDGGVTVLRTAIFDCLVSDFLSEHPGGTVVELGTGLNTRFDRVDNGQVHWIDLDLPDTIESLGLDVVQESAVTRPPPALRGRLPRSYRYALPLARPIVGNLATVTLFRSRSR
jgi:hypothetical protein